MIFPYIPEHFDIAASMGCSDGRPNVQVALMRCAATLVLLSAHSSTWFLGKSDARDRDPEASAKRLQMRPEAEKLYQGSGRG